VLTDGSKGSWDPGADLDALVADRQAECRRAAAVLDGTTGGTQVEDRVLFAGAIDGELVDEPATRRFIVGVIRRLRPQVVLGHDPWRRYRLHPDHRHAGFLTLDAVVAARDPHFFADLGTAPHRPDHLLLWEADLPNHVEASGRFDAVKIEALLAHASQLQTTMGIDPSDDPSSGAGAGGHTRVAAFAAKVHHQLTAHGAIAGIASGEAFHRLSDL
jgi:LmbE family N-acetylglucosaminyl deacetylase